MWLWWWWWCYVKNLSLKLCSVNKWLKNWETSNPDRVLSVCNVAVLWPNSWMDQVHTLPPFTQIDIIGAMVIVWRVRGKLSGLFCAILCRTIVHSAMHTHTRMWANAQRDGRPAKYRWHPLFNATKFGWCPILECHAVTLPRRETRWYFHGCPKLANRSQPLVSRSSPYYEDTWRRYCCLTIFFRLSIHALVAKI